jgi:thioester reductase-like protein
VRQAQNDSAMMIPMANERIVVTGATGFVGVNLVRRLLQDHPDARLSLLLREERGKKAADRAAALVKRIGVDAADRARVEGIDADVSRERCGIAAPVYEALVADTTRVIHCAANVQFDEDLAAARQVNVEGTRHVLGLAQAAQARGGLKRFVYVGTAYVAGERTGLVREDELDMRQRFRNSYERTKFEAEQLVRAHRDALPVTILRPSIIVGDSRTGETSSFKMLYWPLKMYARRIWRTAPGYPDAIIDIVPVDFVVAAIAHLSFDPRAEGRTVHLCAGPAAQATVHEVAERASAFFGVPPPRYVDPDLFWRLIHPLLVVFLWGRKRRVVKDGQVYRAYLSMRMAFDTTVAEDLLGPAGIRAPHVMDYLDRLLAFCRDTNWGHREPAPER